MSEVPDPVPVTPSLPSARPGRPALRPRVAPDPYAPPAGEVEDLIRRARAHPLGTDFLRDGWVDAVSATFKVHAFTVHHARERLQATGRGGEA